MSQAARRRVDSLRVWRGDVATRERLDPSVVMPQRLIERIAVVGPGTLEELAAVDGVRQWRVREWGSELLAACA
jgi:ribonuclease D